MFLFGVFWILHTCQIAIIVGQRKEEIAVVGPSNLGWQAHSYNDLRVWPQVARKSVRSTLSIKVDPHSIINASAGAFTLTHDDPIAGVHYNDTNELLKQAVTILQEFPRLSLRIAMCFKQGADACNPKSSDAKEWLPAVDAFFKNAELVVRDFAGRLEFILDGNAEPEGCLKDRWRPWNATWIPSSNYHSPPGAELSDNETLGYERFQVLNPSADTAEWAQLRSADYGKFKHGSYPFQLWEPDDQATILDYAMDFISGPHMDNPALGLDYAINIDPQMWTVFTAQQTGEAWNSALSLPTQATKPHLALLRDGTVLSVVHSVAGGQVWWATYRVDSMLGPIEVLKVGQYQKEALVVQTVADGANKMYLLIMKDDQQAEIATLTLAADGSLATTEVKPLQLHPVAMCLRSGGTMAFLVTNASSNTLDVVIASDPLAANAIWTSPSLSELGATESLISFALQCTEEAIFVAAGNGTHVFAAMSESLHWKLVGVGRKLSVSSAQEPATGADVISLVNDGGFCYTSHSHNTAADVKVCDQTPVSCSTNLDYTFGSVADWKSFVESDVDVVTPCSRLLHGTYDLGRNPTSALVATGKDLALITVHEGLSKLDTLSCKACGDPVPNYGKLVLDGFRFAPHFDGSKMPMSSQTIII